MAWLDLREPHKGHKVGEYDPERQLVRLKCAYWDKKTRERVRFYPVIDLTAYQSDPTPPSTPASPEAIPE